MKDRIFKSILSVTLAIMLCAMGILFFIFHCQNEKSALAALRQAASFAAAALEEDGEASFSGKDILLVSPDGELLFGGEGEPFHGDEPELRQAKKRGEGLDRRRASNDEGSAYFYATVLSDGSVLRISEPCEPEWKTVLALLRACLLLMIPLAAAASFAARRLSDGIVRPITELDPEHPEKLAVYTELQPVAARLVEQNRLIARKIREMTVKQSEFAAITDNMSEGMLVIGKNAEILSHNKSAETLLGFKGEMPKTVTARDFDEPFRNAVADALAGKKSSCVLRSDKSRYYSAMLNPVFHQNNVEGAVIVILDETEKERRDALRREFTSNVSHELKTPLTSISGFAEIIMNGLCEGEEKRFAGNIYREAKRLIVLVGDIIKLNRLDGGEFAFDEKGPDLLEIAKQTAERLENVAQNAKVTLSVKGESVSVRGNSQILEEMIYNLADNGIKYNNPGGYVDLITFADPDGKTVGITCKDNGIGIPEDQKPRVFERFFRVDKSRSKAIGGTGLGLSIVKHGALSHGAEISLESKEGEGTSITLRFPRAHEE